MNDYCFRNAEGGPLSTPSAINHEIASTSITRAAIGPAVPARATAFQAAHASLHTFRSVLTEREFGELLDIAELMRAPKEPEPFLRQSLALVK